MAAVVVNVPSVPNLPGKGELTPLGLKQPPSSDMRSAVPGEAGLLSETWPSQGSGEAAAAHLKVSIIIVRRAHKPYCLVNDVSSNVRGGSHTVPGLLLLLLFWPLLSIPAAIMKLPLSIVHLDMDLWVGCLIISSLVAAAVDAAAAERPGRSAS